MVTRSTYPSVTIPDLAISQFVLGSHDVDPGKPALIDGSTERVITYAQLHDQVQRIARGLRRLGVNRGDVVAVFGPSSPDYVATFYGVTAAGATITSLNVIHNVAELSYQLIDSGAQVLVLACEPSPALVAASRKARITRVWRLDDVRTEGGAEGEPWTAAGVDAASDVASITYTNAPSDVPMGVMVTHRNLVANLLQTQCVDPIAPTEVVVGLMPLSALRHGRRQHGASGRGHGGHLSALQPRVAADGDGEAPRHQRLHGFAGDSNPGEARRGQALRPVVVEANHVDDGAAARFGRPRQRRAPGVQCQPRPTG